MKKVMLQASCCAIALSAIFALSGCVSLKLDSNVANAQRLAQQQLARNLPTQRVEQRDRPIFAPVPNGVITLDQALELAFAYNHEVQLRYAELGFSLADLENARRLHNPSLHLSRISDAGSGKKELAISLGFAELLSLPRRSNIAKAQLSQTEFKVAASLFELALRTERAWLASVSANQIAWLRGQMADTAQLAGDLAQSYYNAGNINALQLARLQAQASQARIRATKANGQMLAKKLALAKLVTLPMQANWDTPSALPLPPVQALEQQQLQASAWQKRLDIQAQQLQLQSQQQALSHTRFWRWLANFEVSYLRERELDHSQLDGAGVGLQLPIFNQGQDLLQRAHARIRGTQAKLANEQMRFQQEQTALLMELAMQQRNIARYQENLLPALKKVVTLTQEKTNFALLGVFDLIEAKQDLYGTYLDYLQAIHSYWLTRIQLKQLIGGPLPDDPLNTAHSISPQQWFDAAQQPHHSHDGAKP